MSGLLERVLLIGGSGQLGREVVAAFPSESVTAPSHADLDIERPDAILFTLTRLRPTLVVNCAAYHHLDRCEAYPERAFAVNTLAVDRLAAACALLGAAFATFSTDYVFDGTSSTPYREDDRPNPLNAHGVSKLAGEQLVRRHGNRHFIVRTSGVFGHTVSSVKGYTFVDRVLRQAEAGEPVRVVDDVTFSPSYAPHVATALRDLVEREAYGTYHVSNAGEVTWFAFACEAFALRGLDVRPTPVASAIFNRGARRPRYSPLALEGIARAGLPPMPPWREGLAEYIRTRSTGE